MVVRIRTREDYPPNIEAIREAFPLADGPGVIFAFAPFICNPNRIQIPQELVAHEWVHIRRQGSDPAGWWQMYILQKEFRLREEVMAHAVEAESLAKRHGNNRKARQRFAKHVAGRLINPLYNFGLSPGAALALIKKELKDNVDRQS